MLTKLIFGTVHYLRGGGRAHFKEKIQKNYPKTFPDPPPFSMAKTVSVPPFRSGKTSLAQFCMSEKNIELIIG